MASIDLFEGVRSTGKGQIMVPGPGQYGFPGIGSELSDPHVSWAMQRITRAEPNVRKFHEAAKQAYRFQSGKQLSEEDERILKSQGRPDNCFNTAQKYVRYVSGVERDSFVALLFNSIAMENEAAQTYGERVAKLYEWAMKLSNGAGERSRAFEDHLITGMGWTNTAISRARDPRGLVKYVRKSPLTMFFPESDKVNLGGQADPVRWLACEEYVEKEELHAMFPDSWDIIDQTDDSAAPLTWPSGDVVPYKIPYIQSFPLDKIGNKQGQRKDKCRMMEFQWWDAQPGYLFEDPLDGTEQWMSDKEFRQYEIELELFDKRVTEYDRQMGRKWRRMFILGRKVLLEEPSDLPGDHFTYNCMCSHWDEWDKTWYGFFRVLIDPQRFANKFFNQVLEIYGRQAKGGTRFETDAFDDEAQMRAFLDESAIPGSNNQVASGGLQKIQDKQLPSLDAAAMNLMKLCTDSMESVTGISADTLGLGASTAAGTTVQRRQRAGMVLLAPEFDSETMFRRDEGYIVLDHLKLLGDKRLVRVGRSPDTEVIMLDQSPFEVQYDIELDELERDPSIRKYLADLLLGPFGQTLIRMNKFLPEFMQAFAGVYLPQTWVTKIKQMWTEQQKQIQQAQAAGLPVPGGRGPAKPLIQIQAEVEGRKADAALKIAKAQALTKKGGQDDLKMILSSLTDSLRLSQDRDKMALDFQAQQQQSQQGGGGNQ